MRYAIYRVFYSDDKIFYESIKSIEPYVDKVIVSFTDRPWGRFQVVEYDGKCYEVPKDLGDKSVATANRAKFDFAPDKIHIQRFHTNTPFNQFSAIIDCMLKIYEKPNDVIIMEHDHIWDSDQLEKALSTWDDIKRFSNYATSSQIELWRPPHVEGFYYCNERPNRTGVVFWNMDNIDVIPQTRTQGEPIGLGMGHVPQKVYNLGFCVDRHTMFWKHLCAIGFSGEIGDSIPNPGWYQEKWLDWTPETKNLEVSLRHMADIPRVYEYKGKAVPGYE